MTTPAAGKFDYELVRGGTVVARGERDLPAGVSRLRFRDRLTASGAAGYELRLTADGEANDPVIENNRARFVVGVTGPRPLLHVTNTPGGGLTTLLRDAGLDVTAVAPDELEAGAIQLANASGVILENVAAADVPAGWTDDLAGLVEDTGTGLWMTGGRQGFGPGGWFGSAIDPLLPVSMELRRSTASSRWRSSSRSIARARWPPPSPAASRKWTWRTWAPPRCWSCSRRWTRWA